jgi:NDP-sugar pyrophosphorylase family protein
MQVAIIAGGLGTRLGSFTLNQPKSMIQILGKPFIDYQFDFLKNGSVTDVVLCLGYQGQQIVDYCGDGRKYGVNLKYGFEKNRWLLGAPLSWLNHYCKTIFSPSMVIPTSL